jgi:hypothetical protein
MQRPCAHCGSPVEPELYADFETALCEGCCDEAGTRQMQDASPNGDSVAENLEIYLRLK